MKRLYLLIPLGLLGLFAVAYQQHTVAVAAAAQNVAAQAARQAQADATAKQEAERQAKADADAHAAARLAAEKKADDDKRAKAEADRQRIARDTAGYRQDSAQLTAEISQLETKLTAARTARERLNRDVFETARTVELARIEQRNAELEIQRLTTLLVRQTTGTELPSLPLPAVP